MMNHGNMRAPGGQVSLMAATSIVIASMVGTGVFTTLGFQVAGIQSGFVLVMIWVVGGVLSLCGALCYAELAAALPRSGGEYHLLSESYHPAVGFLSGWVSMVAGFAAPVALAAMAFGAYLGRVTGAENTVGYSMLVIVVCTLVYLARVEIGGAFLSLFTLLKVCILLTIIGLSLAMESPEPITLLPGPGDWQTMMSGPFAISLFYVMYAYAGWNASTYIVNEIRDPQRNVPRSLFLGTGLVTVLYVGVNIAFLRSAPMDALDGQIEVGLIAARGLLGQRGGDVMALLICLGLISTIGALTWSGPRVGQMMGQDHSRLRWLAQTSGQGIPTVAVLIQSGLALVFLITASFEQVMVIVEAVLTLSSLAVVTGMVWLRTTRPDLPRPYRTWGYPLPPLLFGAMSLFMLGFLVSERPVESMWGAALVGMGGLIYLGVSARDSA